MLCTVSARFTSASALRTPLTSRRSVRKAAVVRPMSFLDDEDVAAAKQAAKQKAAEASSALQTKAQDTLYTLQTKWEESDNKPGIVATGAGVLFALYVVSGLLDRIDHLPLINTGFELLGLGVTAWFAYRWFFVAGEREVITSEISAFSKKIGL